MEVSGPGLIATQSASVFCQIRNLVALFQGAWGEWVLDLAMAGARNFRLDTLSRNELVSLTEEAAKISGIPYTRDAGMEEAGKIINS